MRFNPDYILSSGTHENFDWAVLHNGMGYRCGYVRVPSGHPWEGKDYNEIDANVHGGLTYGDRDKDGSWWIGFDCGHYCDARDPSLSMPKPIRALTKATLDIGVIRDQAFAEKECRFLCEQALIATRLPPSIHLAPAPE